MMMIVKRCAWRDSARACEPRQPISGVCCVVFAHYISKGSQIGKCMSDCTTISSAGIKVQHNTNPTQLICIYVKTK